MSNTPDDARDLVAPDPWGEGIEVSGIHLPGFHRHEKVGGVDVDALIEHMDEEAAAAEPDDEA